jgi:6-pyruvoyltetrahydropterin/6-carboxytetrahydropterin synthase
MIIRKLFKFENAHIVRNCSSERCKFSLHGHSYKVELFFTADALDNGQMILDFGLTKMSIKEIIDGFDHATTVWNQDTPEYIADMKKHSLRWVELPVSPSAEQFSRVIFKLVEMVLEKTELTNGEVGVKVQSVIVHETDTGYAQCFKDDVDNPRMGGVIVPEDIIFSPQVCAEWSDPLMWEKLKKG